MHNEIYRPAVYIDYETTATTFIFKWRIIRIGAICTACRICTLDTAAFCSFLDTVVKFLVALIFLIAINSLTHCRVRHQVNLTVLHVTQQLMHTYLVKLLHRSLLIISLLFFHHVFCCSQQTKLLVHFIVHDFIVDIIQHRRR